MLDSPATLLKPSVGTPSIMVLRAKPRDEKVTRSSLRSATMPGVWRSTSSRVTRFWSSICWRPMTLTDCGVSRSDRSMRVAPAAARVVYEPVPSVVPSVAACAATVTAGSVDAPAVLWRWMVTRVGPLRTATRPLPASRRSSACWKLRRPDTAGAARPETTSPAASTCTPVWRDSSLSAAPSGWAGTLMSRAGAAAWSAPWAAARPLQLARAVPKAAASAALRSRWRGEKRMGEGSRQINRCGMKTGRAAAVDRMRGASGCKTFELEKERQARDKASAAASMRG
ncbi:hypothetical protein D9M68_701830 [compost metagenome]